MQLLPLTLYSEIAGHMPMKVAVFRHIQEMNSLNRQLEPITQLPPDLKELWLEDQSESLQMTLEYFSQYVRLDLDQPHMDGQLVELLTEYAQELQEFASIVRALLSRKKALKS